MLGRLISELFGTKRLTSAPAATVARSSPSATVPMLIDLLANKVQQLSEVGRLMEAEQEITLRLPRPSTPDEAMVMLQRVCNPLLTACVQRNDAVVACSVEALVYERLVKSFEEPSHYENCFGLMDDALYQLGSDAAQNHRRNVQQSVGSVARVLFFLPNLDQELAHVTLLCDLIEAYLCTHPEQALNIGVVGSSNGAPAPQLVALRQKFNIRLVEIINSSSRADFYVQAAGLLDSEGFGRLVVVAVPIGLSFFTGLLHESRLGWVSMKFELACFTRLRHRCSFTSGVRRAREIAGRRWLEAPPFFATRRVLRASDVVPPIILAARRCSTVFYTINREQKIRNPEFLQAVVTILQRVPDSCFVWTGLERLADIDAFFSLHGMAERSFFAGWIVPDDLLLKGDIFLDTPVLSGTVAAHAAARGCAVLTWVNAHSWINFFAEALERDHDAAAATPLQLAVHKLRNAGVHLECATASGYINQAVELAQDTTLRHEYAQTLEDFAQCYFFNGHESALAHFANFRSSIEAGTMA